MSYGYDAVGNILSLGNSAAIPAGTALYGGTTAYTFGYDNLYELTSATGAFTKPNVPTQKYTLAMSYDGIHNITHKTQTAFNQLSNGSKTPNVPLTYDSAYTYGGGRPHAASQIGNHPFQYDLDGNQAGWNATDSKQNRVIVWDEDDRMQSVTDSSAQPTTFKYDDDTNRVVKKGAAARRFTSTRGTSPRSGRNSKQVFAGATRIVTKLEQFPSGEGYGTGAKNLTEVYQYFYHPDHLGSTGFATDATGEVYQHLEYFPFGETWVDEVSDDTRVPYRFTGQEFDEETKLYYFGARYYDPRTSAWENPDPALNTYLNSKGGSSGLFDPRNLNGFEYAFHNPVKYVDPDGRCPFCLIALLVGGMLTGDAAVHPANAPGPSDPVLPPPSTAKTIGAWTLGAAGGGAIYAGGAAISGGAAELALRFAVAHPRAALGLTVLGAAAADAPLVNYTGGLRSAAELTHKAAGSWFSIRHSAIAIAEVELPGGAVTYFASRSGGRLSPLQRKLLEEAGVPAQNILWGKDYVVKLDDAKLTKLANHAEQIIMRSVPEGSKFRRWGISWTDKFWNTPCKVCAPDVSKVGGKLE